MANNTYDMVMSGNSDNNIRFNDLRKLLDSLNFGYRIKGDHFIYYRDDIPEIINIQPRGNKAKGYEVKQKKTCSRLGSGLYKGHTRGKKSIRRSRKGYGRKWNGFS